MADRLLFLSWGTPVRGLEERGLEVFNEALGLYGRMQQDGRIEFFDVVLLTPNGELNGYMELRGSAAQTGRGSRGRRFPTRRSSTPPWSLTTCGWSTATATRAWREAMAHLPGGLRRACRSAERAGCGAPRGVAAAGRPAPTDGVGSLRLRLVRPQQWIRVSVAQARPLPTARPPDHEPR